MQEIFRNVVNWGTGDLQRETKEHELGKEEGGRRRVYFWIYVCVYIYTEHVHTYICICIYINLKIHHWKYQSVQNISLYVFLKTHTYSYRHICTHTSSNKK